jgi:predicted transport protein|tara:strand:+ start:406 stop:1302 length:897 start_codon:yes stop_codon:yes gene_type:complete
MTRVNLKTGTVIKPQEFLGGDPEHQLQKYVEKHLNQFFQCHYLKNFYKIQGGEIDTLAITEDGNPCIIEYKHKQEDTILNQIVFYYDWLMQKPTKFEFERVVKENEATKNIKVDWSKIRLICVAKQYSKWDVSLIKHLDTDIECYSYAYHENELDIHLDPIINQFKKQKSYTGEQVNKIITLEDHRNKADKEGKELLDKLRDEVLKMGNDVGEGYTPNYIKYFVKTTFLAVHIRRKWLIIELRINEKTFKDPKKLAKDISNRGFTVTREMKIDNMDKLDYAIILIKQAYEAQHKTYGK